MKLSVMLPFYVEPVIGTDLEPLFAKLCLPTGIYFKYITIHLVNIENEARWHFILLSNRSYVMKIHKLSFVSSGISTFSGVDIHFTKSIR